jgi:hypothetical protein
MIFLASIFFLKKQYENKKHTRGPAKQEHENPNKFGEEDNVAAKINSGKLGFTLMREGLIFIKPSLMGL